MKEILNSEKARFERKFIAENIDIKSVEKIIKLHPALFSDIHSQRFINNIYFDSPSLENYYDNIFGKSYREKFRIRWYGNLFGNIENPVLEIKIKSGQIGDKLSYKLPSFTFTKHFDSNILSDILKKTNLPEDIFAKLFHSIPTLVNRYSRKYYNDFSRKYRLTTDTELEYFRINSGKNFINEKIQEKDKIIIELKYNFDADKEAAKITNNLPFRLTKNSKYVNGIEFFNETGI